MRHPRDPYVTNFSRQRAARIDLKILQFEEAIQRQERSLKSLTTPTHHSPPSNSKIVVGSFEAMGGSGARREPRRYVPLNRQEEIRKEEELDRQWQYLQSSKYQRYLQEILGSAGGGKEAAQMVRSLRSNTIYLGSRAKNTDESLSNYQLSYQQPPQIIPAKRYAPIGQNRSLRDAPEVRDPSIDREYEMMGPSHSSIFSHSKMGQYDRFQQNTLNCRPYLQKSSVLEQIREGSHQASKIDEPFEEAQDYWRMGLIEKNVEMTLTPRVLNRDATTSLRTISKKPLILKATTKDNQQRERQKKEFIDRQLSRFGKENKRKTDITTPKPHHPPNPTKRPLYQQQSLLSISKNKATPPDSLSPHSKQPIDISGPYKVDFKLNEPSIPAFSRCASSVTLSSKKSVSQGKSNCKVKMSVVTNSGRPAR